MRNDFDYDAIVVGSGPNGLAAAITLAQAGCSVLVLEANHSLGGSVRSEELTLPGFVHDICSAVHPLAIGSPFFKTLPLERFGLNWIHPAIPLAHPLDDGSAACLRRSVDETADSLGEKSYATVMRPLARDWGKLAEEFLQPMLHRPRHPFALARFGFKALRPANRFFRKEAARALFAGMAAHSFLPLETAASAAFGLVLAMAGHAVGWPIPRGGSQSIANALANYLRELGGKIETGQRIGSLTQLPPARAVLFDTSVWDFARIAGDQLPAGYQNKLERFRRGPGVFKIDYALSSPIPWRAPECRRAGTVHVGGTMEEIAAGERAVAKGEHPERPFVLVAQQSLFDETRAPLGQHTLWAYCHVPNESKIDMSDHIEKQIERFAPSFRDCILARHSTNTAALEKSNANLSGGDINGGAANLAQLIARPILSPTPYRTPRRGLYLCSASTPPGGGVHGMCGFHAARAALREVFHVRR